MALVVNTNLSSLQTQYYLNQTGSQLSNALQQLSSGLRINSAADDAAGYAIASGLTSQVNGLTVASQNASNAISLTQTAEGALQQLTSNLQRIRELAVEAANATNSSANRQALNSEAQQLIAETNREAASANFNGVTLFDGSFQSQNFQIGANAGQTITVGPSSGFIDARASALGQTYSATVTGISATGSVAVTGGVANSYAFKTTKTATVTGLVAGKVSVDGVSIGAAITDGVSSVDSTGSAIAVANAINSAGIANVTASAKAAVIVAAAAPAASTAGTGTGGLKINGVAISGKYSNVASLESLINAQTSATGVIASDNGTGLVLTGVDGRNITVTSGAADVTGLAGGAGKSTLYIGQVTLTSSASTGTAASIQATDATTGNKYFGAVAVNQAASVQTTSIDAINISTITGASNALIAIDTALNSLNQASASLGAVQNRFQSVVDALASSKQSDTAALSTIQDADFAAQTAAYTRAQVLQSAGESMLAQANANPQHVLQLLQNL